MTRYLFFPLCIMFTLSACATHTSTPTASIGQAIADAQGIVGGVRAALPLIATLFPKVLSASGAPNVTALSDLTNPAGTGKLDIAANLLANLSASSPVAITNLQSAEADINLALSDLAAVAQAVTSTDPQIATAASVIEAAIVLAPGIEALVNGMSIAPAASGAASAKASPAAALARAVAPPDDTGQARGVLHIPTVGS